MRTPLCCCVLSAALPIAPAAADILHDEAVHGDLSGDRFNPTAYTIGAGTHSVIAASISGDLEYLRLTIPAGQSLSAIVLAAYTGLDQTAFIGVQSGPTFTEPPNLPNPANLLGWTHFGPNFGHVGTDILDDIGMGLGAIGFTPPLPEGVYTFWIQQTGQSVSMYQLDFVIVPAPAAAPALIGLVGLVARRRR